MNERTPDLFIETAEKCPICGFYKRICMCAEESQEKSTILSSLRNCLKKLFAKIPFLQPYKKYFNRFVEIIRSPKEYFRKRRINSLITYHKRKSDRFFCKSDKAHEKAMRNYEIYRLIQESQIDLNKLEFKGLEIKVSNIDWGKLERKATQTKAEGVV